MFLKIFDTPVCIFFSAPQYIIERIRIHVHTGLRIQIGAGGREGQNLNKNSFLKSLINIR